MTSQKKKTTQANRKKLNLLLLFLNIVLLGLLAVFMLNRPNQSKSKQQQAQTSQSKTTAKWKTYDEPVQIPILMYHAVHVMDPSEASNANLIVDPDLFEAQIKALAKAGYYFLTPEEAYKAFTENALPAKKVVWLTFDDGNEDFYTVNHPDLSATDKATQKVELTDSIDFLENKLNTKVNTIAYPSGRYNQTTLDLAKKTYKLGLTTNEGLASAKDGLLSLNRVRILPTTTAKGLLSEIDTDNE